jgi:hypothetical protein
VPAEKPAREKRDKAMEERKNSTTIEMSYACCLEFCFLCSTFLSRLHRCELELELLRLEKEEKQNSICAKKKRLEPMSDHEKILISWLSTRMSNRKELRRGESARRLLLGSVSGSPGPSREARMP